MDNHSRELRRLSTPLEQPNAEASRQTTELLLGTRRYVLFHKRLEMIANRPGSVMITGQSGAGKSTFARYLHTCSPQRHRQLHRWGCGEFENAFANATLFGHTAQAFTGARKDTAGLLETADGGTLILDDVDYLSPHLQAKLLRYLDDGSFHRMGEPEKQRHSNVRIIATTNKNLSKLIDKRAFLPDLFFRMRRWWIHIPSLDTYPEGIARLATYYLESIDARENDGQRMGWHFSSDALQLLSLMSFPGNYRELEDVIENLCAFAEGSLTPVTASDLVRILTRHVYGGAQILSLNEDMSRDEKILQILNLTKRNVTLTAEIIGCARNTVYNVGKKHSILS